MSDTTSIHEESLEHAKRLAKLLDSSIPIPGTNKRIGLDGIISMIPGVGDSAAAALSSYIIYQAYQDGVSRWTLTRMAGNVLIDILIGAVPLFGDFADFFWRSNVRNVELWSGALERARTKRDPDRMFIVGFVLAAILIFGSALWLSFAVFAWTWKLIAG